MDVAHLQWLWSVTHSRQCQHSLALLCGPLEAEDGTVTAAFQNLNRIRHQYPAEGNEQINAAKEKIACAGSMVYFYLANGGAEPVKLVDIRWAGSDLQEHTKSYQAIWCRMMPDPLEAGGEAEIALCLRTALTEPTDVTLVFSDGTEVSAVVDPAARAFRIQTLRFSSKLDRAYVYVQRRQANAVLPETVYVNGKSMAGRVSWFSDDYCNDVRVAEIRFDQPFVRGSVLTFRVASGDETAVDATTIRALADRAIFGSYGLCELQRFADNGLCGFNSFTQTPAATLDQAQKLGMRILSLAEGNPAQEMHGHPANYAFGLIDEPDCQDYGADRPNHLRIGAHAPSMVEMEAACRAADPLTATSLTLNLTYTPYNYFTYAPIADIPNPDCYPISVGWSIRKTIEFAATMAQAAAPNPFTFTYQSCWEEWAMMQDPWVPGEELHKNGYDHYRDPCRVRGLGRKPVPSEVRIPMLYAIGCGATGLWAFTDASGVCTNLMFHGSDDLPELWAEVGRTSRQLHSVAPVISISHATDWAVSDSDDIWLRTLWAGREWALVIAVNDAYSCTMAGFQQKPQNDVPFHFKDLPWLSPQTVYRVADGNMMPVSATRSNDRLSWNDTISDGEIYLIGTGVQRWPGQ